MHCEASDLQTINHDSKIGRVTEWQGPPAIIADPVSASPSTSPRCGPCRWAATHGSSASAHRPMSCILRATTSNSWRQQDWKGARIAMHRESSDLQTINHDRATQKRGSASETTKKLKDQPPGTRFHCRIFRSFFHAKIRSKTRTNLSAKPARLGG